MVTEYLDWTSLESVADATQHEQAWLDKQGNEPPQQRALADLLEMDDIPDELKQLVNRQRVLEQQLDELTGNVPLQDWNDQRFPMPQHSAESRLVDKQKAQRQEENRSRIR